MKIATSALNKLTLAEIEDFEEASGWTIQKVKRVMNATAVAEEAGREPEIDMPIRVMTAMVWIIGRRENDGLTLDDVRALSLDQIEFVQADDQGNAEGA